MFCEWSAPYIAFRARDQSIHVGPRNDRSNDDDCLFEKVLRRHVVPTRA